MSEDKPESKQFNSLFKAELEYCADSIEWCPHEPHHSKFVCGNYELVKHEDSALNYRLGRVLLHSIADRKLSLLQTIDTAAVLDQKWCPDQLLDGHSVLGVVADQRLLYLYKLDSDDGLIPVAKHVFENCTDDTLILSLDWSTTSGGCNAQIVCSDSKGDIHLLKLLERGNDDVTAIRSWHSHDFQAWIAGFYYWDANVFFSGGDDGLFVKYDVRCGGSVAKNRVHEAGVTSFHSNKSREYVVVSGSYDEHVRLWDIRTIKYPLSQSKMPGPVWRLKWDPFTQTNLLAACMLGGVHILNAMQNDEIHIADSFYGHSNIAYGSDWCFMSKDQVDEFDYEGNVIIGSCSFYDKLLHVSKTQCNF